MAEPFILWSFDMGVRMGVAMGDARSTAPPVSTAIALKKPYGASLMRFLSKEFRRERPTLVFKEAPIVAMPNRSGHVIRLTHKLHGVLESMCEWYGIPYEEKTPQTIRKHFIDASNLKGREATNRAVLSRCQLLGYLPRDNKDWDRANALAGWHYAKTHYARVPPELLHLFGEQQS